MLISFQNAACLQLMKSLNRSRCRGDGSWSVKIRDGVSVGDRSWSVKIRDVVAVQLEGLWYRGVCAAQVSSDVFNITLMDFGKSVRAPRSRIKPLRPEFSQIPAFCHQVILYPV